MSRQIFCQKLQKMTEALPNPPFPGETGQKIYQHIGQEAWQMWLSHQTILINEYRLSTINQKDRDFLKESMVQFLFKAPLEATQSSK